MRVLPLRTSVGATLLYGEGCDVRNLALCGLCGAVGATVKHSNPFLPVTRPLSSKGEREQCSFIIRRRCGSLAASLGNGDYKRPEDNRDIQTMGRLGTQRFRPTRPPGRSGPLARTAGGIGGEAPASLDSYGQSRTKNLCVVDFVCLLCMQRLERKPRN